MCRSNFYKTGIYSCQLEVKNTFKFEYKDISMKIKGIKFEYDVQFSYEQQHIDALDMAKAVVNNVITGKSLLINIRDIVSDFGGKKTEIEVRE